jgi:hypothetical protein
LKKLLYNSKEVRAAIIDLFRKGKGRRVAISAFIGKGAESYLANPKGIEIVCWPKAGGTNPNAIRDLIALGAKVFFSDSLHMKIYWAEDQGCIISSANLSTNALGSGNLKECGIFLEAGNVEIDMILDQIDLRPVSHKEILKLDRLHKLFTTRQQYKHQVTSHSFLEWFRLPLRPSWNLFAFERKADAFSAKAISIANTQFGVPEPEGLVRLSKAEKRACRQGDWNLLCGLKKERVTLDWYFCDLLLRVPKTDKNYDPSYPFEVVQLHPLRKYPSPPFRIDKPLRIAFQDAIRSMGQSKAFMGNKPSAEFLNEILQAYKKQQAK